MTYTNEQLALKLAVERNQGKPASVRQIKTDALVFLEWLEEHRNAR